MSQPAGPSDHLARALLPRTYESTRRSGYPVAPSPAPADRVLIVAAGLGIATGLWLLIPLLVMGL